MLKYKYLFLPYDEAEIGAIEGWLELMADRGFKLMRVCIGNLFKFEQTLNAKVRYCIHPHIGDTCYNIHGWIYVGALSRNFDVFIAEDNNDADKPDIDSACMEAALRKQILRHRDGGILFFWVAASWIIFSIRLILILGGFITFLIDYDVLLPIGMLVGIICALVFGSLHFSAYIKRKKRITLLMERKRQPVIKSHKLFKGCLIIIIIISLLVINVQRVTKDRLETIPLDEYTVKINLPLMDQISPGEWFAAETAQEKYSSDEIIDCFVTEESFYVAPTSLGIRQYGSIVQDVTDTYGKRFGYNVHYFEIRNEGLAICYEEELCRNLNSGEMTAIYVDGFDSASYFLNGEIEDIVLRSGNIVITAMYYGSGSLLDSVHHFSMAVPH